MISKFKLQTNPNPNLFVVTCLDLSAVNRKCIRSFGKRCYNHALCSTMLAGYAVAFPCVIRLCSYAEVNIKDNLSSCH